MKLGSARLERRRRIKKAAHGDDRRAALLDFLEVVHGFVKGQVLQRYLRDVGRRARLVARLGGVGGGTG